MHENRARNTLGFIMRFRTLGRNDLPEGYTRYKVDENVYDRYESDYEGAETPDREKNQVSCTSKKSCCKIGRLSNLQKRAGYYRAESLKVNDQEVDGLQKCKWSGARTPG